MRHPHHLPLRIVLMLCVLAVSACASFQPKPIEEVGFLDRAETQHNGNLKVTVAVPSIPEGNALFGAPIGKKGIQPVWLKIENNDPVNYWLFPIFIDPDYYSPYEAAWKNHFFMSATANEKMDAYFNDQTVPLFVPPGETVEGFIYTNLDEGTKQVLVELIGPEEAKTFIFYIAVPGIKPDHQEVDWYALYVEGDIVDYHDEDELRVALEALPCCTMNKDGTAEGDPLNFVIITTFDALGPTFLRRGWQETETTHAKSVWRTVKSFLLGSKYRYSPISPLYVYGRGQDIAIQKARDTIHERNHLRLWITPMRFQGMNVWVGQISRDIGVRFTTKSPTFTTHKIDPDIDEARAYLIQDLLLSQHVAKFGMVRGFDAVSRNAPRENLTGDPWFTDGLLAVFVLSEDSVAADDIAFYEWEAPRL